MGDAVSAAHTPGPWVAVPLKDGTVSIQSKSLNGYGDYVALVYTPADVPLLMVNQELLARPRLSHPQRDPAGGTCAVSAGEGHDPEGRVHHHGLSATMIAVDNAIATARAQAAVLPVLDFLKARGQS